MSLLIFSNTFLPRHIMFRDTINKEQVIGKGLIQCVQEFIRDDNMLDEIHEDEHRGLDIRSITEHHLLLEEIMAQHQYWICADTHLPFTHFVEVNTTKGHRLYLIIKFDEITF